MKKLASLWFTSVSILVGIGFVVLPERTLSQVIVNDQQEPNCFFFKERKLQKSCQAFKLTRARDEKTRINGLRIEFLFKDLLVTYIVSTDSNGRSVMVEGREYTYYPVLFQTIEQRGFEPKRTTKPNDFCGFVSDYSRVVCHNPVTDNNYSYTGKPVRVQQNTSSPENSAGNENQYVFNTNSYVNTGISVNPGDEIKIQASGRIVFGFFAGSGGPRGIVFNPNYNYFADMLHGQLMGRVRQFGSRDLDGWFPIGEGGEFVARSQGTLEFAVNDNKPRDNSGSFRVEVTINRSRK